MNGAQDALSADRNRTWDEPFRDRPYGRARHPAAGFLRPYRKACAQPRARGSCSIATGSSSAWAPAASEWSGRPGTRSSSARWPSRRSRASAAAASGSEREARAAARLNHPAIVGIYELASDEHDVYLVSELVRGRTLAELLRAGALSDRDVARIGAALCEALAHAHARGVIHRDVKPQNVIVVAEPAAGVGLRQAHRLRRRAPRPGRRAHRARATWWERSPTWPPSRRRARA